MQIDVKLLEAFRAVVENTSVTGAAQVLGVTQPAVSAQISRLEAQVGFPLFDRANGRLRISAEGRRFYEEVRTVLGGLDKLADIATTIRSGERESLVIASHPGGSTALLPTVMPALLEKRPGLRARMIHRTSEEVAAVFEAGGADVAICEWPVSVSDAPVKRYRLPCVAIVPRGHALAGRPHLTPRDLDDDTLIGMAETRLIGHTMREVFVSAGARWQPAIVSEYFSTICGLVASGAGVALVDVLSARFFAGLGLTPVPFAPDVTYEIAVFRRTLDQPEPVSDDLLALIDQRIRQVQTPDPTLAPQPTETP
ncbi:LysR family transcriptional regulator [Acuticoccus sediminis]|uniref:LysR family transcriptional regulator n=1 Tax=Acuticoccus sediminis TaxID=2184697 RepID=UPI001CFE096D|nr:LysR family transcriptional regulator [Acuticoccus sediminis]